MTHKALLCGINAYRDIPLRGCVNDALNIQDVLLKNFAFQADNIRLLLDQECIKSGLLEAWQWLTQGAVAGDVLLFHFSGHGSYIPDKDGEEEDLQDEITCLQNFAFDDPDSYMVDDEWYELVQSVDPEVQLLIIRDTCHSGGSSRFMRVRQESGQAKIILASKRDSDHYRLGEVVDEHLLSNARFIVPPNVPAEAWQSGASRRRTLRSATDIHTNLMACGETQTAADAHINGDYQGAFTYSLCELLRQGSAGSSTDLITSSIERLRGRYEQVPQHEGRPLALSLLAATAAADAALPAATPMASSGALDAIPPDALAQPLPLWPELSPGQPTTAMPQPLNLTLQPLNLGPQELGLSPQQMVYLAHMRFLDTMQALAGASVPSDRQQRSAQRVLVSVHGIGSHGPGYSHHWWQAIKPHVGGLFGPGSLGQGRAEVLWSDLVNAQRSAGSAALSSKARELREEILELLEDRRLQQIQDPSRARSEGDASRGVALAIDDFLIYMVDAARRQQILERFTSIVRPLLAAAQSLEIVSHSWGTVVAYEGLRELENQGLGGRVNTWFTVGSALSLGPVQGTLRPGNQPAAGRRAPKPSLVQTWINLDAKGDHVGGPIGHRFEVSREFLNLEPTGCSAGPLGYNLGCAHSSYFNPANLAVNRDIVAATMLGGGATVAPRPPRPLA
jgi:hypothetical protein